MLPFSLIKRQENKSHFEILKNKWETRYKSLQESLWKRHGEDIHAFLTHSRQWTLGTVAGLVMLASNGNLVSAAEPFLIKDKPLDLDTQTTFMLDLMNLVPHEVRPLTQDESKDIAAVLSKNLGFLVTSQLQGKELNTNYGYIGAEQHLARFPGDNMASHLQTQQDTNLYYSSGMAPGLGAWRYFAPSQEEMTEEENLSEKYYIAVQTFLSPGYNEHVKEYNDFFKFRKMLVVNPQNGRAIVTNIADAGPSPWTGKQFGGSPEVMHYLQRVDGAQKGTVLIFFIDDPENKVHLGPIAL